MQTSYNRSSVEDIAEVIAYWWFPARCDWTSAVYSIPDPSVQLPENWLFIAYNVLLITDCFTACSYNLQVNSNADYELNVLLIYKISN